MRCPQTALCSLPTMKNIQWYGHVKSRLMRFCLATGDNLYDQDVLMAPNTLSLTSLASQALRDLITAMQSSLPIIF
ncbi:MAG: hypothetical protein DRG37_08425, partial [Deltaproteobacteria bacterium]